MALLDLFSRRKRQAQGISTDVYSYDEIPNKVRVQIVHIFKDAIGGYYEGYESPSKLVWDECVRTIRQEKGVFELIKYSDSPELEFCNWILQETEIATLLDGIELTLRFIDKYVRENDYQFRGIAHIDSDVAISTFNARMEEAAVGYQYENRNIIQVNSKYIHAEVVVPALNVLQEKRFATASSEFHAAHQFLRSGDYEQAIVECCKAFESVLKVIGGSRGWNISENDAANKLLAAAYGAQFIPPYLHAEFTALRSLLESGTPTVRNRQAGHGAGAVQRSVPKHLAAFQLHQTAAAVNFLVAQDRELP
jgi:hypothetical protein